MDAQPVPGIEELAPRSGHTAFTLRCARSIGPFVSVKRQHHLPPENSTLPLNVRARNAPKTKATREALHALEGLKP
eukprot:4713695-Pyramimonas_sp.AAC.1